MDAFKPYLAKVATGARLTADEARAAFDDMLSGEVTPSQMGAFLMALRVRGETVEEITGAVTAIVTAVTWSVEAASSTATGASLRAAMTAANAYTMP